MKRLSDGITDRVKKAIRELEILEVERQAIEWEVMPFVTEDSSVGWLIGIGLPVPATGDTIMPFTPLNDVHSQAEISRIVRALYEGTAIQVDQETGKITAASNGHGESPGGLIIP